MQIALEVTIFSKTVHNTENQMVESCLIDFLLNWVKNHCYIEEATLMETFFFVLTYIFMFYCMFFEADILYIMYKYNNIVNIYNTNILSVYKGQARKNLGNFRFSILKKILNTFQNSRKYFKFLKY